MDNTLEKMTFPIFEEDAVIPFEMARDAILSWAKFYDTEMVEYLDSGAFGHAFKIKDNKVIKITTSLEEALFAYEAMFEAPDGYVPIHSVEKINDTVFIIEMDYLNRPEYFLEILDEIDAAVDRLDFLFHEDPFQRVECQLETDEVVQTFIDIYDIVNESKKFVMTDIHADNIGLDCETGEVVIFDQPFHKPSDLQKILFLKNVDELELYN